MSMWCILKCNHPLEIESNFNFKKFKLFKAAVGTEYNVSIKLKAPYIKDKLDHHSLKELKDCRFNNTKNLLN